MDAVMTTLGPDTIRDLVRSLDPTASVYIGLRAGYPTLDAAEDLVLRWRSIATRLATQGADEATVAAIGARVLTSPDFPAELAVFARAGRVAYARAIPGGMPFDRARFAAPADVLPVLAWLQRHPAHVVVVTDRTGADVTAVPRGAVWGATSVVVGPDDEIERNAPGGWAQPRYQRRAEDSWAHNAAAVAAAASRALHDVDGRLLLVAGDVRAVQLLRERLPHEVQRTVSLRHLPGGRSPDGSQTLQRAAAVAAVEAYTADVTDALLARFAAAGGPAGTAVEGVAATLAALAEGRVRTLFVADDPADDRTAWFGPHVLCAAHPHEVPDADSGWRAAGRLVDVAVRAALLTDAEVRVVDRDVTAAQFDGDIGALCRFALPR
jgi:hypothetical protein